MIFISCADVRSELSNYMDREVSPELRARIEEHVRSCDGCRAIYDDVCRVLRLVGENGFIELPRGFSERLYSRLNRSSSN